MGNLVSLIVDVLKTELKPLSLEEQIDELNNIKLALHEFSPFRDEPVDCVIWVKSDAVHANDYNPNVVAPPEMELLQHSIISDGYTQPIVTHADEAGYEVVDGFHRNRVGKECHLVSSRVLGRLPVVQIRASQNDKEARMASTIRHNRARGKHGVDPMTDMVSHLSKKGWTNQKIAKELGMDADEVLRFKQVSGLAELFLDREFSPAWDIDEDALADESEEDDE